MPRAIALEARALVLFISKEGAWWRAESWFTSSVDVE